MAFNPIEYLEQGKVDFLFGRFFSSSDIENLIKRVRNSSNKNNIINGFLPKLKKMAPHFCFEIIYDTDEYVEELFNIVKGKYGIKIGYFNLINNPEKIKNILNNTTWGRNFVFRNLNNILRENKININPILEYIFSNFENNMDFIKRLSIYKDMNIRYIFMKYLIKKHPDKINIVYDDIMKYIDGYTYEENEQLTFLPDFMSKENISDLAVTSINVNRELWQKLKEYILINYKANDLAFLLLKNEDLVDEFKEDANRLFVSSSNYKNDMYRKYKEYISEEIINNFERYLNLFKKDNFIPYSLRLIFENGLWNELVSYVDKYLEISKDKTCRFISSGSTSECYKIGDYIFKLNRTKWSYEDIICPNLYLIAPNLEEHFVRDKDGVVKVGIEVQKYLSRSDIQITDEHLRNFTLELNRLGYYVNDRLINGVCGDNVAILDSYMDADCSHPELLPETFKEVPLVLIDRDRVYKLNNKRPKQLRERWS